MHALGLEFGSAAQLSKRPGSVLNCLWGNALKRSPGIIRKSRVSYPGPGFLSSATWPSLPKKHYNGLNQTKLIVQVLARLPGCHTVEGFREGSSLLVSYLPTDRVLHQLTGLQSFYIFRVSPCSEWLHLLMYVYIFKELE